MQSPKSESKKIKIKYRDECMHIYVLNNRLKKSILKEYFPEGSTLTYEMKGEKYLLDTDEETIYMNPHIDTYDVTFAKGDATQTLTSKKMVRVNEILNKFGVTRKSANNEKKEKKSMTEMKIGNKKQKVSKDESDAYTKRVVFVGWKHRNNYDSEYKNLGPVLAPKVKVSLNGYKNYSLENLKRILIEHYVQENNAIYFTNCDISIGTSTGKIIDSFKSEHFEEESLWVYVNEHHLRNKSHELHLCLFTTTKEVAATTEEINNMPSCSSVVDDRRHTMKSNICKQYSVTNENLINTPVRNLHLADKEQQKYKRILQEINEQNDIDTLSSVGGCSPSKVLKLGLNDGKQKCISSCEGKNTVTSNFGVCAASKVPAELPVTSANFNADSVPSPSFSKLTVKTTVESDSAVFRIPTEKLLTNHEKLNDDSVLSSSCSNITRSSDANYYTKRSPASEHYLQVSIRMIKEKEIKFSNIIIGSGGQSCVRKGKYLGTTVAIKSIGKGKDDKLVLREILLLDKIRHPNIISIIAACNGITQLHIVMEYFISNSLFHVIFDEKVKTEFLLNAEKKNKICYQSACALAYLHLQPQPIIHRDMKPNNILVNTNLFVKLCDLGLGKCKSVNESLQSTQADTMRGTYLFMAPEIILHRKEATVSSDIWSFGCTAVELYSEQSVWDCTNFFSGWNCAIENLRCNRVPDLSNVPSYIRNILYKCFEYNPEKRATAKDVLDFFSESEA